MNKRMEYDKWKAMVEVILVRLIGIDSEAIPDFDYRKAYTAGKSPWATAKAAIAAAKRF